MTRLITMGSAGLATDRRDIGVAVDVAREEGT